VNVVTALLCIMHLFSISAFYHYYYYYYYYYHFAAKFRQIMLPALLEFTHLVTMRFIQRSVKG